MPGGRPSTINEETTVEICARLAEGSSLRKVCRDPEMPGLRTVMQWLAKDPKFAQQYARAKEECADAYSEEIVDIADEDPGQTEHGTDSGKVAHMRLRVDARKWVASKLKPKKYGDAAALKVEGTGDDGRLIVEIIRRQNAPGTLPMPKMDEDDDG